MSSFFVILFKVIPHLMPFFREMLIGKKTWKQAFRENRVKTILTAAMAISLVFNVVLVTKVSHLAVSYLELSRAKHELEAKYRVLEARAANPPSTPRHPRSDNAEVVTEVPKDHKSPRTKRRPAATAKDRLANDLKADLDRIRRREAAAEH